MAPLSVFDQLVLHPFVGDLPAGWLHRLAVHGHSVQRDPGHRLFRAGAPADRFWLLGSGVVVLRPDRPGRGEVELDRLGPGDVAGWSWLVPPYRWTVGGVVAEPCHAVEFAAPSLRCLLGEDPDLGYELATRFLVVMSARLGATRRRLAGPEGPEPDDRSGLGWNRTSQAAATRKERS